MHQILSEQTGKHRLPNLGVSTNYQKKFSFKIQSLKFLTTSRKAITNRLLTANACDVNISSVEQHTGFAKSVVQLILST